MDSIKILQDLNNLNAHKLNEQDLIVDKVKLLKEYFEKLKTYPYLNFEIISKELPNKNFEFDENNNIFKINLYDEMFDNPLLNGKEIIYSDNCHKF